jgi:hypothetical protein
VREQANALENIANAPAQDDRIERAHILAINLYAALARRLTRRSSVVLPEPDAPTMARNSRSRTANEMRSSTGARLLP